MKYAPLFLSIILFALPGAFASTQQNVVFDLLYNLVHGRIEPKTAIGKQFIVEGTLKLKVAQILDNQDMLLTSRRFGDVVIYIQHQPNDQMPIQNMSLINFKNHKLIFLGYGYYTTVMNARQQVPLFKFA